MYKVEPTHARPVAFQLARHELEETGEATVSFSIPYSGMQLVAKPVSGPLGPESVSCPKVTLYPFASMELTHCPSTFFESSENTYCRSLSHHAAVHESPWTFRMDSLAMSNLAE